MVPVAALCSYALAYRFYSAFLAAQGLRARRRAHHTGPPARRRQGFRAHQPLGRVRASLRRDRGAGPARRPDPGGAIRLPARDALHPDRRGARRRRAGLHDPRRFDAPRRQEPRPDDARGGRPDRRHRGARRDPRDPRDPDRGARARRRERHVREPLGHFDRRRHDPDRDRDGDLPGPDPPGPRARGEPRRSRARDSRGLRRPPRRREPRSARLVRLRSPHARAADRRLRVHRERAAGLAAARAARLSLGVREDRHDRAAGGRAARRAPGGQAPGVHAIHRRQRADLRRQALPVLLHHDRLRRDLGLPLADRERHDAQAARSRDATRASSATARC